MQFDINIVAALSLVLGGFGWFVRLTIKSSISDLKDALAAIYMSKAEVELKIAAIVQRLETIEKHYFHAN